MIKKYMFLFLLVGCVDNNQTQMVICAANNKIDCVRSYLESGESANGKGKEGASPFYAALYNNNFDVADIFIKHGVKLDGETSGKPLVLTLLKKKKYEALEYLFSKGLQIKSNPKYMKVFSRDKTAMKLLNTHINKQL